MHTWTGQDPWLQWILSISSLTKIPSVISISYGSDERAISSAYFHSFKLQALKLAARGTTIVASTGNTGANTGTACGYFAQFPATIPYVLAVGATQGPEAGNPEIACSVSTGASITSGGGFSNKFKTPTWQQQAVSNYLSLATSTSGFNRQGRGYPDIALLAKSYEIIVNGAPLYVSGTSAATPVMAAMISLVNAQRLRLGKKTLGWINPLLYNSQIASTFIR
jgi:tripeptidyl-peptidase-1